MRFLSHVQLLSDTVFQCDVIAYSQALVVRVDLSGFCLEVYFSIVHVKDLVIYGG